MKTLRCNLMPAQFYPEARALEIKLFEVFSFWSAPRASEHFEQLQYATGSACLTLPVLFCLSLLLWLFWLSFPSTPVSAFWS
jgi:hypothetical protein